MRIERSKRCKNKNRRKRKVVANNTKRKELYKDVTFTPNKHGGKSWNCG